LRNENNTGMAPLASLMSATSMTMPMLKLSIIRLTEKKLIIRGKGRPGRGGYYIFFLPKDVTNLLSQYPSFLDHSDNNFRVTNIPINMSNEIDSNVIKAPIKNIPQEWTLVDYSLLEPIGFSITQIMQLIEKNNPDAVQESIKHFAYALENNNKYKSHTNPLNLLMGVLRKGQAWIEKNYRSQQEITIERLLEIKKDEKDRIKKLEDEANKLAYEEWISSLSSTESKDIITNNKSPVGEHIKLKSYFSENIWPQKKKEFLGY
jgi:hypothetical protein